MWISEIVLERFKKFRERTVFEFSEGLNLIKGPNESGKSTLLEGLIRGLFTVHTHQGSYDHLNSWGQDKHWWVRLKLMDREGKKVEILKDMENKSGYIREGGEEITHQNTAVEEVKKMLGCPDETFFLSTVCVKQDGVEFEGEDSLIESLQSKISGSVDLDIEEILEDLKQDARSKAKTATGPCKILEKEINPQIEKVENRISDIKPKVEKIIDARVEVERLSEEVDELGREYKKKTALYDKNNRIIELSKEIKRMLDDARRFDSAREIKTELDRLKRELKNYPEIAKEDIERIEEIEEEQRVGKKVSEQRKENLFLFGKILSITGGVGLILSIVWGVVSDFTLANIITGVVSLVVLIAGIVSSLISKGEVREVSTDEVAVEVEGIYKKYGIDTKYQFKRIIKESSELRKEIENLESKLSGYCGDITYEEFREKNLSREMEYNKLKGEIEELKKFKLSPEEVVSLEREKDSIENELDTKATQLSDSQSILRVSDVDPEELTSLEEEYERLIESKGYYERRMRILEATRELIKRAKEEVISEAAPVIEEEMNRYISTITRGRYEEVRLNPTSLAIEVKVPETAEFVSISELSFATEEQFYLVARLALAKYLTGMKRPPIFMDDPMVHFDPERRERTRSLIEEFAKKYQVFIFTCHDWYDDWGGNLVELG